MTRVFAAGRQGITLPQAQLLRLDQVILDSFFEREEHLGYTGDKRDTASREILGSEERNWAMQGKSNAA